MNHIFILSRKNRCWNCRFLENMLVLNSYSKIYGIPGLRLGFLAASMSIMAKMGERRKPWGGEQGRPDCR